jgi:cytoskeletal protein CcmA (bactofilin family)
MTKIGASIEMKGELTSSEEVMIAGRFTGDVHVRGALLTIARSGSIDGTIRAARIVVHGTVVGPISATERIELGPQANVSGDLSAARVAIADGASFNGHVDMARRTIAAKVAQFKGVTR